MDDEKEEVNGQERETYLCRVVYGYKPDALFSCGKDTPQKGKGVILDDDLGEILVDVKGVRKATEEELSNPDFDQVFRPLARIATPEDVQKSKENEDLEKEIFDFTKNNAKDFEMDMRLVKVVSSLDSRAVMIMYFASDRVDFREFVKACASKFHVRVKMWQIGNKDRAKIVGGLGVCGLPLCCSTFLDVFVKTSISMAKTQLLNLNIPKISGQCGNLMCCLGYENDYYKELVPLFPKVGESVTFKDKTWTVTSINVIADTITVTDESKEMMETYSNENWKRIKNGEEPIEDVKEDEDTKKVLNEIESRRTPGPRFMPIINKEEEKKKEETKVTFKEEQKTDRNNEKGENMKYKKNYGNNKDNKQGNNNKPKGRGMARPGPFGFKPIKLSDEHQAQVNPFGFASHNGSNAKDNKEDVNTQENSVEGQEYTKKEFHKSYHNNDNQGHKHYNNHKYNNGYHKYHNNHKHDNNNNKEDGNKNGFDPSKLTLPDDMK